MAQEVRLALQVAQRFANYYETSRARLWYPHLSLAWLGVSPGPFISDDPNAQTALVSASGDGDVTPAADKTYTAPEWKQGLREHAYGVDVRRYDLAGLRHRLGVVPQEAHLFTGDVASNIAYGRPGASEEEIAQAARLAHADEFIADLVDHKGRRGYDAQVGERGVKLSGGQRQRIAIARVILKEVFGNGRLAPGGDPAVVALADRVGVPADRLAVAAALANPWAWRVLLGPVDTGQLAGNVAGAGYAPPPGVLDELAALAEPAEQYWAARSARPWS